MIAQIRSLLIILGLALTSGCGLGQTNVKHNFNESEIFANYEVIGTRPQVKDGALRFEIKPGMAVFSTDRKNNTERQEVSYNINISNPVVVKGKFRVNQEIPIHRRFMISQIMLSSSTDHVNPVAAVYANRGGRVKCTTYDQALSNQSAQWIRSLSGESRVKLNTWNDFEMQVKFHTTNGLCRIWVNGELVQEVEGRTIPYGFKNATARIGVYRDSPTDKRTITVDFDYWDVNQPANLLP